MNHEATGIRAGLLEQIVERVVEVAHPSRVILFGSAARGEADADSDVDLVVVVPGDVHRGRLAGEIYHNLQGLCTPVDVVVVTEDDVRRYGDKIGTVLYPALREGIVIYAS